MHMLAEGFVISAIATFIGLLLASIALDGMQLAMSRMMEDSPSWWRFEIDARAATVAVAAALLSTVIAGLPAAIRASRPSLDSLLRDGGRTGTGLAIGRIACKRERKRNELSERELAQVNSLHDAPSVKSHWDSVVPFLYFRTSCQAASRQTFNSALRARLSAR